MHKIIGTRREDHEWMLLVVAICSVITLKKVNNLEGYKNKLKNTYTPY